MNELTTNPTKTKNKNMKNSKSLTLAGKKIIIILGSLNLGGAERQALLLARHLSDVVKVDVEVWGYGRPGLASEICNEAGIRWRSISFEWFNRRKVRKVARNLKNLLCFALQLRLAKPDVLLPYYMLPNVSCGLVWRLAGISLCVWNQRDEGRLRMSRWAENLAVRLTPLFVSNSAHALDFLIKELYVPPKHIHVIKNGITLSHPQAASNSWRSRLGIEPDTFVACMVANLHSYKDHITLLKAWKLVIKELRKKKKSGVLLLAGRFDNMGVELKALAFDLELGNTVRFLGQVKDMPGLLQIVDLGVFSSIKEGCPNGILECMATGLPVVATDIPGIREAVGQDGSPYLASPGDVKALASQIVKLASDSNLRASLGEQFKKRIEAEFSPQKMCSEMVNLIARGLFQA